MKSLLRPLMLGLITACAVVSSAIAQPAGAECSQPVKIIVSYPPGSPDDVIARILAQKLSEAGGRFHVENLPGAGGTIGTATAARRRRTAAPWSSSIRTSSFSPRSAKSSSYEVPESFTPVALLFGGARNDFGQPIGARDHHEGACRAGEGKSRQVQLRLARLWFVAASGKRAAVQTYARARRRARPVPRRASGRYLDGRRSHPDPASYPSDRRPAGARRQTSTAGCCRQDARSGISGRSHA